MTHEQIIDTLETALNNQFKSQGEFSRQTGISQTVISSLFARKRKPQLDTVLRIAEALERHLYVRKSLAKTQKKSVSSKRGKEIRRMILDGKSTDEICSHFDINMHAIYFHRTKLRKEGLLAPYSKREPFTFSIEDENEIKRMRQEGVPAKKILEKFGMVEGADYQAFLIWIKKQKLY